MNFQGSSYSEEADVLDEEFLQLNGAMQNLIKQLEDPKGDDSTSNQYRIETFISSLFRPTNQLQTAETLLKYDRSSHRSQTSTKPIFKEFFSHSTNRIKPTRKVKTHPDQEWNVFGS